MTLLLGVVADDYTGASDLANTLAAEGLRTVQTIGVPRATLDLPEVDAVVVALKSRSIAPERAVALSVEAETWLRARGAAHVLFKICSTFDSTDRGNIGPVTDALRARSDAGAILVTPAFPETGRTVFMGNLFVGTVPLAESPLKDHPLNPMRDSDLVRVLARQSAHDVGLLAHATVARGPDAVRAALAATQAGALIADAVDERALETLGTVAIEAPLSVGASGLGLGIARALVARARRPRAPASLAAPTDGPSAILAGSCAAATLAQIREVEGDIPVLRLDADRILGDADGTVAEALAWARPRLAAGPVLIASSTTPDRLAAVQQAHGGARAGEAIEAVLAAIAAGLVDAGVSRLVVAGGETSGAVVDRLGIEAFAVGAAIAAGVPALRATGARHAGLSVALKSGNFGGEGFFRRALSML